MINRLIQYIDSITICVLLILWNRPSDLRKNDLSKYSKHAITYCYIMHHILYQVGIFSSLGTAVNISQIGLRLGKFGT